MKTKDIIALCVSGLIIVVAAYFLFTMMAPKKSTTSQQQTAAVKETFTGKIDNDTLNKVNQLKDYGESTLDNIGRDNPFGPLN